MATKQIDQAKKSKAGTVLRKLAFGALLMVAPACGTTRVLCTSKGAQCTPQQVARVMRKAPSSMEELKKECKERGKVLSMGEMVEAEWNTRYSVDKTGENSYYVVLESDRASVQANDVRIGQTVTLNRESENAPGKPIFIKSFGLTVCPDGLKGSKADITVLPVGYAVSVPEVVFVKKKANAQEDIWMRLEQLKKEMTKADPNDTKALEGIQKKLDELEDAMKKLRQEKK